MAIGVAERFPCIVDAVFGVQQSVDDAFRRFEDGSMLMQHRHFHLLRHILELDEVLGEVGSEVLQPIAVVIDKPTRFTI